MVGFVIRVFSSVAHAHLLQNILKFFRHPVIINGNFDEKVAIIIIKDTLNIGLRRIRISNRFNKQNVKLCFVDNREFNFENRDFYRQLARDTGGKYMMLQDAAHILTAAVLATRIGEYTLRQAFLHIPEENYPMPANNQDNIDGENQVTENGGDLIFDHGLSY
ncbi:unnamed protein product [Rotaria socialis]|uniref:Uncharacterized protein n=1 Tax=Rotaria socialis TaxID=392032 RepID=A0A818G0P7_9BILA|nr:unnamed protein product [Rotaria socialis]CAF3383731.1 unnamed protein product [Rotaria socialis]CAF3482993.1 unnamed protein product [Rotaria socialis]CAF3568327.1 unnamed protein product [Rotaria socialis]CAF3647565.1 unnamed protein product [Rotaria socialis]